MEEKIGIKKLYKLLFEYSRNKSYYWTLRQSGKLECSVGGTDHDLYDDEMAMVIKSKEFGFIKWLVDNDKIDLESYCRITSIERKGEKDVYRDEVDSLLMLLSISDTPIEFLLSILK